MDGLRPRNREIFISFTKGETEKMDKLMRELGEQVLEREFCQSTAKSFNRSAARAGKPIVRWTELQSWFENRVKESPNTSRNCPSNKAHKEEKIPDVSELEFEARSSKDGAWCDIEKFLVHRFLSTGETEVRVRFVGFGAEEDEWVNVKKSSAGALRATGGFRMSYIEGWRSCPLHLERRDQAIYYDSHITDIQRKMHDIRGCRCFFTIRNESVWGDCVVAQNIRCCMRFSQVDFH